MTTPDTNEPPNAATLLACLQAQAERRGAHIALRQKLRGIWRQTTWQLLAAQVEQAATALTARGFESGDRIAIATAARSEAFVVSLAAQWLGGTPILVELPLQGEGHEEGRVDEAAAQPVRFAFVEAAGTVPRLQHALRLEERFAFVICAQSSTFGAAPANHSTYAAFSLEKYPHPAPQALSILPVWTLVETMGSGHRDLSLRTLREEVLLQHGRASVEAERLLADRDACTSPGLTNAAVLETLAAPWFLEGFRLNFPEQESTADQDRRELGPELVLATSEGYTALHRRILENLPREGTWARSLLDWAFRTRAGTLGHSIANWLVRRPLRDVIGFTNVTSALVVGSAPAAPTLELFSQLGVVLRLLPRSSATVVVDAVDALSEVPAASAFLELAPGLESKTNLVGGVL